MSEQEECPDPEDTVRIMYEDGIFSSYNQAREILYISRLVKDIFEENSHYRGLAREGYDPIISAYIVLASRVVGAPVSDMEMIHLFRWEQGSNARGNYTRRFFRDVKRRIARTVEQFMRMPIQKAHSRHYAHRWLHQTRITPKSRGLIQHTLEHIEAAQPESPLSNLYGRRQRSGIAAAVIYGICRKSSAIEDKYSQLEISTKTKVTEVTIRDIINDFHELGIFDFGRYRENDPLAYENVYIVTNTQFEDSIKFGKSGNPVRSYRNLGRYSPNHPYIVEWYFPCNNSREVEASILEKLREEFDQPEYGTEWFNTGDVMRVKEIIETDEVYANNRQGGPVSPVYD